MPCKLYIILTIYDNCAIMKSTDDAFGIYLLYIFVAGFPQRTQTSREFFCICKLQKGVTAVKKFM